MLPGSMSLLKTQQTPLFAIWTLLRVTLLAPRLLRLLLDFMKIYTRLDERVHTH